MTKNSNLKILLIGDVVARPGRRAVQTVLPQIKEEEGVDLVIANAENLAGGKGINEKGLYEMIDAGVDFFTSGNHVFYRGGWEDLLENESLGVVRPANYAADVPGVGYIRTEVKGVPVVIMNLEGQYSMDAPVNNPFLSFDKLFAEVVKEGDIVILDFHAEATSEKRAMGFYVDGRANIIYGTHTHVPTADAQVLKGGTFYISDVGMCGNNESVLGVKKDIIINRFINPKPRIFEWEYEGEKIFNSVLVEISSQKTVVGFARADKVIP
ncbi:YmdB family metallophosphoesterase [candidate division WWE3 bacterium]|uniref:YmdB family metallophosphoesterase n=1 Tax=candidate division WWE3 bacterium TaxID=2053526 RepID=A0A955RQF1_UNCKA|nr:YmdB family metallophosphoesterase [candidate division WWE3 bacterium]